MGENVRDTKIKLVLGTASVEFVPEHIIDRPVVHQSRRRTITGKLAAVTFYTKREMSLRTWMQQDEYDDLAPIVNSGGEIEVTKSLLVGSVWTTTDSFNAYVQHPFNPEHTDTLWRFELRLEES